MHELADLGHTALRFGKSGERLLVGMIIAGEILRENLIRMHPRGSVREWAEGCPERAFSDVEGKARGQDGAGEDR